MGIHLIRITTRENHNNNFEMNEKNNDKIFYWLIIFRSLIKINSEIRERQRVFCLRCVFFFFGIYWQRFIYKVFDAVSSGRQFKIKLQNFMFSGNKFSVLKDAYHSCLIYFIPSQ